MHHLYPQILEPVTDQSKSLPMLLWGEIFHCCLFSQLCAVTPVAGIWSVRHPTPVVANQDTQEPTVRRVSTGQQRASMRIVLCYFTVAMLPSAICQPACVNGGLCIAPDICQCLRGFHGETCQEGKTRQHDVEFKVSPTLMTQLHNYC